jgi:hypothetical protein
MAKRDGLFIGIYGPPKAGKTVCAAAAAASGIVAALPGAMLSVNALLGFDFGDREKRVYDVNDSIAVVRQNAGKVPTILVDDLTIQVENLRRGLEKKNTTFGELWRMVCGSIIDLRDVSRHATTLGTTVIVTCHEAPPKLSGGKPVKGGPGLPGQLPQDFSGMLDIVARAMFNSSAAPWKYELQTGPIADYSTGDRLNIFPSPAPMNLAEGLRAAGYDIPRPAGLEWMEAAVKGCSEAILKGGLENWRETSLKLVEKLNNGTRQPKHIRWVITDALHRAIIQSNQSDTTSWLKDSDAITI